jgi:DNA-binding MarR family transcriptional regulator
MVENETTKINYSKTLDLLKKHLSNELKNINLSNFLIFTHTADMLIDYMDSEFQKYGLNRTHVGILYSLILNDGISTPTELSNFILRSKNAVTIATDNLEKKGYVKSEKAGFSLDARIDRRVRTVRITEKGLDIIAKIIPVYRDLTNSIMSCLDIKSATEFNAMISKIRESIKNFKSSNNQEILINS